MNEHKQAPSCDRRRILRTAMALPALAGTLCRQALASEFPSRPLRVVVPFASGGGTDVVTRLIVQRMGEMLRQPIVVDNRTGAGGSLGSDLVAKAPADGYTLLMGTVSTHALNPALYAALPFDPQRDFTPLSLSVKVPCVAVINAKLPFRNFAELIAGMRAQPGKYTFGSQGVGGVGHLLGEMVNSQARVRSVHVPYRGAALAVQDLIAGNIDMLYDTPPALLPHIQSGTVRPLLVTSERRILTLPDVPAAPEAGYPQLIAATWNALFAPAGLPATIQKILTDAAMQAVRTPAVVERLRTLSAEPVGSSSQELAAFLNQEILRWAPVVRASGARLE